MCLELSCEQFKSLFCILRSQHSHRVVIGLWTSLLLFCNRFHDDLLNLLQTSNQNLWIQRGSGFSFKNQALKKRLIQLLKNTNIMFIKHYFDQNTNLSYFLQQLLYIAKAFQDFIYKKYKEMLFKHRIVSMFSSLYKPTRGKVLEGKWNEVVKQQKFHSQGWSNNSSIYPRKMRKVPAVEDFRRYIQENPLTEMYLQAGLDSIPQTVEQFHDQEHGIIPVKPRPGVCHGYHWQQLLDTFASICQTPPMFENADIIGVPFLSIVIDLLNTEHGRFFFSIPEVNKHLKQIFNTYAEMLDSPISLQHLNGEQGGWLSPQALKRVDYKDFICDPSAPNYGFKSWHDWFTREIKEEARPMNDNENEIVNNSEAFPYPTSPYRNVQWKDRFWLKDQKYSLSQMFNVSSQSEEEQNYFKEHFVGGTVYQGFLNPWCYHRWRAPVSGVIEKCYSTGNSYFVGNPSLSSNLAEGLFVSQPLLSMISTRQIYVIKADNPKIDRICAIQIGMVEVSAVKNLVKEGQRINKGDLLGYFRYGGSSHAMIFSNKASNLRFSDSIYEKKFNPETSTYNSLKQKVRSPLAWVS